MAKFKTVNPATGETLGEYETETSEAVLEKARCAKQASRIWGKLDVAERASLLRQAAAVLRNRKDDLARMMTLEMGKPISQSSAEVEKCAWTCEFYADNAATWLADELMHADGKLHMVAFEPLGAVLSVMPWNFPFWQAFRFAVPALAAGNAVVLKHSNVVPGCALAIESVFSEAGFPPNVFRAVIADHDAVAMLVASPSIDAVSLTGSVGAGGKVGEAAGRNLKKCVLELGGSDPFIVLEDADIESAARGAVQGRTLNSGQSCIAAKRFIVVEKVAERFTERFVELTKALVVGDPLNPKTDVGPLANEQQLEQLEEQLQDSIRDGAKVLAGGRRKEGNGFFFEPTVVGNVNHAMRIARDEVFGPVAPIIIVRDADEAIRIANDSEFGLGASVWSRNEQLAMSVARQLEAGVVFVNSIVKSDPRMPFGGIKKSGIGRELSRYGLREFVNVKAISVYEPASGFGKVLSE